MTQQKIPEPLMRYNRYIAFKDGSYMYRNDFVCEVIEPIELFDHHNKEFIYKLNNSYDIPTIIFTQMGEMEWWMEMNLVYNFKNIAEFSNLFIREMERLKFIFEKIETPTIVRVKNNEDARYKQVMEMNLTYVRNKKAKYVRGFECKYVNFTDCLNRPEMFTEDIIYKGEPVKSKLKNIEEYPPWNYLTNFFSLENKEEKIGEFSKKIDELKEIILKFDPVKFKRNRI